MSLFSQRIGKKELSKKIQREAIDTETRNLLWSTVFHVAYSSYRNADYLHGYSQESIHIIELTKKLWLNYFKRPIDELPDVPHFLTEIKTIILSSLWYECLDLLEVTLKQIKLSKKDSLRESINSIFQSESCAYRFVENEIVEITDELEINEIETALAIKKPHTIHLENALNFISDRKNPDYRNSIKESISAVESICREVTGNPTGTLGDLLKNIKKVKPIHPVFEVAMSKLYGYTSAEGGIRHGLTENAGEPDYADAKYFLVICSSFINYVYAKK